MNIIERQAKFIDNHGNEQNAIIRFNNGIFLDIDTFNQNNSHTGYIRMYFHPNNRLFLSVIYCHDEFRGAGIASIISDLADYILKDNIGYVIRGAYEPKQLSTDRNNKIERTKNELDIRARNFYSKNGYEIIKYEDYLNNQDRYSYLTIEDFILGEDNTNIIVAKPVISKQHPFYEEDEIIYHTNYNKSKKRYR